MRAVGDQYTYVIDIPDGAVWRRTDVPDALNDITDIWKTSPDHVWAEAEYHVTSTLDRQVAQGTMSFDEAKRRAYHDIVTEFANLLRWDYRRIPNA
jgi:ligand-binding SRPBCC domain-containing protein